VPMNDLNENVTAFVLAGGKSQRFGQDKALIRINNKYLIEIIINQLQSKFPKVIVVANKTKDLNIPNFQIIRDMYENSGPLAGIHSALYHSNSDFNFITACDMPFINLKLVDYLLEIPDKKDAIIPTLDGKLQPLFALYNRKIIHKIEDVLNGKLAKSYLAIHKFIELIEPIKVEVKDLPFYDEYTFANINTVEDFDKFYRVLSTKFQ
jgi:molybdopterin-guanine dinucleotide biosynthesis protein A